MKKDILTGVQVVDNYPYGRLKAEMRFSVEFNGKKGYRTVTQSVNPKTGRLNKPHKSTYNNYVYMFREPETGHIKFGAFNFRCLRDIEKFIQFITENEITFTTEESQNLFAIFISLFKITAGFAAAKLKEGVTIEQFLDVSNVKALIKLYKENADINEIKNVIISADNLENFVKEGEKVY